jgi:glycosyltransferase involved in cell wall biosynthesis
MRPARGVTSEPSTWPTPPPLVVDREVLPLQPDRERIKLLHVITRFAGGSGANTLLSAAGMDPERYEVWIAGAGAPDAWERAERSGIRTVPLQRLGERISPADDVYVLVQLYRLIRRERFSIVHTHCAKGGFLGRLAGRFARTPVVVHTFHAFAAHSFMRATRRAVYLSLERLVRPMAHRYVAVSPQVAREAVEQRLAAPGTIEVVPSAVELERIPDRPDRSVRRELGIPEDRTVVGWVGRMVRQKAPLDFVRMAALVRQTHPGTVFVMIGDAAFESEPLEQPTREEASRLGIDIVFTGFRRDAARLASTFDVFVVSSLYEGLGRALTEAMASGRPIVATAVNGVPDLVEPGSTGLLAAPSDPEALAECVRWMLDHPEEARRMGKQARARVVDAFGPSTMAKMLDRLYRGLLGLPHPISSVDHPLIVLSKGDSEIAIELAEGARAGRTAPS